MNIAITIQKSAFLPHSSKTLIERFLKDLQLDFHLSYTDSGKPYFTNSSYGVSVSHSQHVAVVVISAGPVGIDIEIKRTLSDEVIERFSLTSNPIPTWCKREALAKYYDDSRYVFEPSKSYDCLIKYFEIDQQVIGALAYSEKDQIIVWHKEEGINVEIYP